MTKEKIQNIAKSELSQFLSKPGRILYSSYETLKPGSVYLLGLNPGGIAGNPIKTSIDSFLSNKNNAYLDECWENGNGFWKEGEAPLQKRVRWLLEQLDLNPREVCASNLIFFQSREAKDIDYSLADICWPVHQAIIEIVKPNVIIAFGNSGFSPYGYLHSKLGGDQEFQSAGHGDWNKSVINKNDVFVAGLPHLSRYSPIGKNNVSDWLRKKL
ncbi:hypothetical protein BROC_02217 [Candidatus Brocadiaceae bacterium]|nr:hypothetical protein BROC_02217 [Candidatus Brocadiaceae bacterium]